jgi:hypothetical protein
MRPLATGRAQDPEKTPRLGFRKGVDRPRMQARKDDAWRSRSGEGSQMSLSAQPKAGTATCDYYGDRASSTQIKSPDITRIR